MKFDRDKCKLLSTGNRNQQTCENDIGIVVDYSKQNMSQQSDVVSKKTNIILNSIFKTIVTKAWVVAVVLYVAVDNIRVCLVLGITIRTTILLHYASLADSLPYVKGRDKGRGGMRNHNYVLYPLLRTSSHFKVTQRNVEPSSP